MLLQIVSVFMLMLSAALCAPGGARQNLMRLARSDKTPQRSSGTLDSLGGGNLLKLVDPYSSEQIYRSLDLPDSYQRAETLRMLEALTSGDLMDSSERAAALETLRTAYKEKHPKRMLDSVSGWAFGENKRNFDEIDNVGFTGFAKKSNPSPKQWNQMHAHLAKKNFDEIDRAGFETYNKRNFDEIDRAGFENYQKRH